MYIRSHLEKNVARYKDEEDDRQLGDVPRGCHNE